MIKVSISCMVYNHEKYIQKTLEGFISQETSFEFEVIVHDDASTDNSASIIKEYAEKYPTIIKPVFQIENKYSTGIKVADKYVFPLMKGEYIALCEGDDYWSDPHKLQKQVDFLDSHQEYVACVHNTLKLDMWHGTSEIMYNRGKDCDLLFKDTVSGGSSCYHTSSLMYRRSIRESFPNYMKKSWLVGDYPMAMFLTTIGKVRYLNDVMSVYRFGTEFSYTRTFGSSSKKMAKVYSDLIELLREIDYETHGQYHKDIVPKILENKYYLAEIEGRYKDLRVDPLYEIYKKKGFKYKMRSYLLELLGPIGKQYLEYVRKKIYK